MIPRHLTWVLAALVLAGVGGCKSAAPQKNSTTGSGPAGGEVVLYTSVDDQYVRPLAARFTSQTGIQVRLVTDAEMTKTAGLVEKLQAEKDSPQATVYWGNEPFHTINLAAAGLLAPYASPTAGDLPARWRDKDGLYTCIGLRARTIVYSTRPQHAQAVANLKGLEDLTNPALKGKVGISNPGFGTASGQMAALYVLMGPDKFQQLMRSLRVNDVKLLGSNSAVVDQVASGALAAGLTDTDDVTNAQANGAKVAGTLPDQAGMGTLLVPTTIALVKGGPNPEGGRKLIDWLLRPEVEQELIKGRFLAYSTRTAASEVKAMEVDYAEAARQMRPAVESALKILQDRADK